MVKCKPQFTAVEKTAEKFHGMSEFLNGAYEQTYERVKVLNLRRTGGWVSTLSRVTRLRLFILSEKHPLLLKRDIVRDREGDGAEEKGEIP